MATAAVLALLAAICTPARAQDTFLAGAAAFRTRIATSARLINPRGDSQVQLQRDLGFGEHTSFVNFYGGLRLGGRDEIEFEAFKIEQSGSIVASRHRRIGGVDFLVFYDLATQVSITTAGATWARTLANWQGHEFGSRLGVHLVSLEASVRSVDLEQSRSGHGLAGYPHAGLFVRRGGTTGWAWSARADVSDINVKRFEGWALSLGAKLEHRFGNGLAVGAEYRYWDADFATTSRSGTRREYAARISGPAAYVALSF